jgi:uncharacterized MAPEG superfamily protein
VWEKCFRAYGAHLNAVEHFSLFATTTVSDIRLLYVDLLELMTLIVKLAGNMVGLSSGKMNVFATEYLVLRLLYTLLYINTTSNRLSYLRSVVWFGCTGLCMWTLVQAGVAWNMSKGL